MNKKKLLRILEMTAFAFLMIGGLNLLLMGLFNWNMVGAIFGGVTSVTSRVFFSLFGIAALTLLAVILFKAFATKKPVVKMVPTEKAKETKTTKSTATAKPATTGATK